jgi:hypothetical protein
MVKKKGYGSDSIKKMLNNYTTEFEMQVFDLEEKIKSLGKKVTEMRNSYGGTLKDLTSKVTGFIGIGSLIVAFYFLAPNFTGNVIGNLEIGNTNLFGMGLFLFGLINIFVCLRKK